MKNERQIKIEILQDGDLKDLIKTFSFAWTSSEATKAKWEAYLAEQKAGNRIVCLAKWLL